MSICVDTSAFYAYMVARDRSHEMVRAALDGAVGDGVPLFSTSLVLGETLGLLQNRHGKQGASLFMERVYPAVEWVWVDARLAEKAWKVAMGARGGRSFGMVDASVVVATRERPGSRCAALDPDFGRFGIEVVPVVGS